MNLPTRKLRRLGLTLLMLIVLLAVFQEFFRYYYIRAGGTTWRIDRLTQQACRMSAVPIVCTPPVSLFDPGDYVGTDIGVADSDGIGVGP